MVRNDLHIIHKSGHKGYERGDGKFKFHNAYMVFMIVLLTIFLLLRGFGSIADIYTIVNSPYKEMVEYTVIILHILVICSLIANIIIYFIKIKSQIMTIKLIKFWIAMLLSIVNFVFIFISIKVQDIKISLLCMIISLVASVLQIVFCFVKRKKQVVFNNDTIYASGEFESKLNVLSKGGVDSEMLLKVSVKDYTLKLTQNNLWVSIADIPLVDITRKHRKEFEKMLFSGLLLYLQKQAKEKEYEVLNYHLKFNKKFKEGSVIYKLKEYQTTLVSQNGSITKKVKPLLSHYRVSDVDFKIEFDLNKNSDFASVIQNICNKLMKHENLFGVDNYLKIMRKIGLEPTMTEDSLLSYARTIIAGLNSGELTVYEYLEFINTLNYFLANIRDFGSIDSKLVREVQKMVDDISINIGRMVWTKEFSTRLK